MGANSFGNHFQITTWGESHGPAMGVVIDGCPSGIPFADELLCQELERRRPGRDALVSPRKELDQPQVLSGVYKGKTLGTPIAIVIENRDARPQDYDQVAKDPRPGHADDLWREKFGHVDHRGGGRASGRETVARVAAGAVAQMVAAVICPDLRVMAFASNIGPLSLSADELAAAGQLDPAEIDNYPARFPASKSGDKVKSLLRAAVDQGKSYGGIGRVMATGIPRGLGAPVFNKLKADLAAAWMGIGAVTAVELGAGFAAAGTEGTVFHDPATDGTQYGGIRGGLATGEPITANLAFKPPATVLQKAKTGRHDPCVLIRALPVIEAMTWLTLTDHLLWNGGVGVP